LVPPCHRSSCGGNEVQPALRTVTGRTFLSISLLLLALTAITSAQTASASPASSAGTRQSMEGVLAMVGGYQTGYDPSPTASYPYGIYSISGTGENISEVTVRDIELIAV